MPDRSESSKPPRWLGDVNLLLVVIFWGVNMPIMKFALGRMDKYAFNSLRLSLSAVTLGFFVWWLKARVIDVSETAKPRKQQFVSVFLFALFTAFAYQVLFLIGIDKTSAGNTALIMTAIPMWIAVLSFIFLKERLSRAAWAGLTIAVIGVLIVTLTKAQFKAGESSLAGNLIVSGAALAWAVGSVWSKPLMKNISPVALTFYSICLMLPFHFFMAIGKLGDMLNVLTDPWLLAALCYSGIFSTGLATAMWNIGIKQMGPSHAGGFQNLVPLVALIASWALIGEVPFLMQLVGGCLIIAGVLTMRAGFRSSAERPSARS